VGSPEGEPQSFLRREGRERREIMAGECIRCNEVKTSYRGTPEGWVCTDCDNMARFKTGEDGAYLCKVCGKAEVTKNYLEGALREGLCFNCSFWAEVVEETQKGRRIIVAGSAYFVGNESAEGRSSWRGFGGSRFVIQDLKTEKVTVSTNLWHNGKIPEHFREQLPDTARFLPSEGEFRAPMKDFKEALEKAAYGDKAKENREKGLCIECGKPALENCYSDAGRRETKISGLCELCFDKLTVEDEELGDDGELIKHYNEDDPREEW
jgi:hypothetical protein